MANYRIHCDYVYHRPWNVFDAASQFVADFKTEDEAKAFIAKTESENKAELETEVTQGDQRETPEGDANMGNSEQIGRLERELEALKAKRNDIRELLWSTVDEQANADRLKALASVDRAIDRVHFAMAAIELATCS